MKQQVTLRIDTEPLDFYKAKGEGWQTFINTVLGQIRRECVFCCIPPPIMLGIAPGAMQPIPPGP